jgi:hypothetical protein
MDGRSKLATMPEFSETAILDHPGEIYIGLGAIVVLDRDEFSWWRDRLCRRGGTRYK